MPTLFQRLQDQSKRTIAYPMHEPWLDIGRPDDLRIANSDDMSKVISHNNL
jgi:NDP-sugar pyrophosphorylase family protein